MILTLTIALLCATWHVGNVHAIQTIGPSTVNNYTTVFQNSLFYTFQHHVFYANGYYWVFWYEGATTKDYYASSVDGVSWSGNSTIANSASCTRNDHTSVWWDGSFFEIVIGGSGTTVCFTTGTPAGGALTLSALQTITTGVTDSTEPNVTVDGQGHPWIVAGNSGGSTGLGIVTSTSTGSGIWATAAGFPKTQAGTGTGLATILPTGNTAVTIISEGSVTPVHFQTWDGATLSALLNTTTAANTGVSWSATTDGSTISAVYSESGTFKDIFLQYSPSSKTFITNVGTSLANPGGAQYPQISYDAPSQSYYVITSMTGLNGAGSAVRYSKINPSGIWSPEAVFTTDSEGISSTSPGVSSIAIVSSRLQNSPLSTLPLVWSGGGVLTSNFDVRIATFILNGGSVGGCVLGTASCNPGPQPFQFQTSQFCPLGNSTFSIGCLTVPTQLIGPAVAYILATFVGGALFLTAFHSAGGRFFLGVKVKQRKLNKRSSLV